LRGAVRQLQRYAPVEVAHAARTGAPAHGSGQIIVIALCIVAVVEL
jgi:hypothetical protein